MTGSRRPIPRVASAGLLVLLGLLLAGPGCRPGERAAPPPATPAGPPPPPSGATQPPTIEKRVLSEMPPLPPAPDQGPPARLPRDVPTPVILPPPAPREEARATLTPPAPAASPDVPTGACASLVARVGAGDVLALDEMASGSRSPDPVCARQAVDAGLRYFSHARELSPSLVEDWETFERALRLRLGGLLTGERDLPSRVRSTEDDLRLLGEEALRSAFQFRAQDPRRWERARTSLRSLDDRNPLLLVLEGAAEAFERARQALRHGDAGAAEAAVSGLDRGLPDVNVEVENVRQKARELRRAEAALETAAQALRVAAGAVDAYEPAAAMEQADKAAFHATLAARSEPYEDVAERVGRLARYVRSAAQTLTVNEHCREAKRTGLAGAWRQAGEAMRRCLRAGGDPPLLPGCTYMLAAWTALCADHDRVAARRFADEAFSGTGVATSPVWWATLADFQNAALWRAWATGGAPPPSPSSGPPQPSPGCAVAPACIPWLASFELSMAFQEQAEAARAPARSPAPSAPR